MQQYANVACSKCFGLFPGNVMRSVKDRVVVGETAKRLDGELQPYGHETQYGYESGVLCPSCFGKRRRRGCAMLLVLAAGVSALIWVAFSHGDRRASVSSVSQNQAFVTDIDESLLPPAHDEPEQAASPVDEVVQADEPALATEPEPVASPSDSVASTEAIGFDDPRLRSALQEALAFGRTVKWADGGQSGHVVVSEGTTSGSSTCRNVYFTVKEDGEQRQSETRQFCELESGDWSSRK